MTSVRVFYLLFSVIAVTYLNQVVAHEPPSLVESWYKQGQEYLQGITKQIKESGFYIKEIDEDKSFVALKGYMQKASDVILESAKRLEKETKPYGEDIQKQIYSIQLQVTELSKQVKHKEIFEKVEKLHDTYVESLKKLSEQLCELAKTSPLKQHIPEKIQLQMKQMFEEISKVSQKLHFKISELITEGKKKYAS